MLRVAQASKVCAHVQGPDVDEQGALYFLHVHACCAHCCSVGYTPSEQQAAHRMWLQLVVPHPACHDETCRMRQQVVVPRRICHDQSCHCVYGLWCRNPISVHHYTRSWHHDQCATCDVVPQTVPQSAVARPDFMPRCVPQSACGMSAFAQ